MCTLPGSSRAAFRATSATRVAVPAGCGGHRSGGSGAIGRNHTSARWRAAPAAGRAGSGLCRDGLHRRTSHDGCGRSGRADSGPLAAPPAAGRRPLWVARLASAHPPRHGVCAQCEQGLAWMPGHNKAPRPVGAWRLLGGEPWIRLRPHRLSVFWPRSCLWRKGWPVPLVLTELSSAMFRADAPLPRGSRGSGSAGPSAGRRGD